MGILSRVLENRFVLSDDPPEWFVRAMGWSTDTGVTINQNNALESTAVFGCVRILAESIASLPLVLYRRRPDGGKERAPSHRLYPLLHDLPNPEMTSMELRETLMGHLGTWGNAFANIEYRDSGYVGGLWPLRPDKMRVKREGNQLAYYYRLPDKLGASERILTPDTVLHIRGLGFDGLIGYSPISLARQAIGLALATEKFGAKFFEGGARPGVVLEHPGELSEKAQKRLRESWEKRHQGLEKAHRIAILEEGMKLHEVGIPPEDAQFLQTRKFQVTEIARMYRIPPHMLADLERATFSNIEHQSIEFVVHTIRPWLVRWEQAISRDLLSDSDRNSYFAEFLVDGLLRGDIQSRYQAYATARQNGWMNANDIRRLENMNPIPGGEVYLVPLNMIPAGMAGDLRTTPDDPVESRQAIDPELRARRSATARRRLANAHDGLFVDTAARILRREINDIRNNARKHLQSRDLNTFNHWLDRFFEEHHGFVQQHMRPVYQAYAELVATEAGAEIGADDVLTPELERFVQHYVEAYAGRHIGSSQGQIRSVVRDAIDAGGDPLEALDDRFSEWEERRPGKIAMWETVRSGNAISKFVYAAAGILYLRWVAFGESCPYCSKLNGRIVGIKGVFLSDGEEFQPEGVEKPLTTKMSIGHPPAHGGCDCMITAA